MRFIFACVLLLQLCLSAEETFMVMNGVSNEVILEMGPHINERISPCSSFKIVLSLMGYDAHILQDELNPVWDYREGYDDFRETWKGSQTPQSWMKYSCLWYSKLIAEHLGLDTFQEYLTALNYGNCDASGGFITPSWINSSILISPREQVNFIRNIFLQEQTFSRHAIHTTKKILFKEELQNGWKLFGKTGWSGSSITRDAVTLEHGWFVGWIEKDQHFFPFAYLIRAPKIDLDARIPRVKHLVIESNLIKI